MTDRGARWPAELASLRDELEALFRSNPYLAHLGAELVDWGLGWAEVRAAPGRETENLVGTVHGGMISGLADSAFEVACNSYGRTSVAIELTCHFLSAAMPAHELVARAVEVGRSRRTASYRIDVFEGDSAHVASFMALAYRTDKWHLGHDRYPGDWRANH